MRAWPWSDCRAESEQDAWLARRLAMFHAGTTDLVVKLSDGSALRVVERRMPDGRTVGLRFDVTELESAREAAARSERLLKSAIDALIPVLCCLMHKTDWFCAMSITGVTGGLGRCGQTGVTFEEIIRAGLRENRVLEAVGREEEWVAPAPGGPPPGKQRLHPAPVRWAGAACAQARHARGATGLACGWTSRSWSEPVRRPRPPEVQEPVRGQQSHEIPHPMNAILGMLHLLQTTELTARQKDYAEKSESAAKSLLGILNDILDFSKVEAGKLELDCEPFSFDKLVRDLATIYPATSKASTWSCCLTSIPASPKC